jgi:arabinan endo-1,5-alpha-L-arabinosidase
MNLRFIALTLCSGALACACSSGSNKSIDTTEIQPPPLATAMPTVNGPIVYNDVPVHDPSVVRADDGSFYVIGSHLAMAHSDDLVTWTSLGTDIPAAPGLNSDPASTLFDTYASEAAGGIAYVGGWVGSWAGDIIKLADGRWYFYYDHCAVPADAAGACTFPRSYLGVAVSDNIEGPYSSLGEFLWSGQTDAELAGNYPVDGVTSFDPAVDPNVIDPAVFYDKAGNLWMTYGSYSGGIFVLRMDGATGMPMPGQGYGTHIAGGNHSAIEGTFVLYSPDSDYYYLFMSFGGLAANDGYNVRVERSRNPDGPYVDAEGQDMVDARGGWDQIEPFGMKLIGGFIFAADLGDVTPDRGYLAPGGESAYYDADTGKYLLVLHTRFPNRGEQHAIRVHEMFMNENGWLVVSPHRFAPMTGANSVSREDAVGSYRLINLGKDINREAKRNTYVNLNADRSVSGSVSGTYQMSLKAGTDMKLTLDGTVYDGVIQWQWDEMADRLTPTITAISGEGVTVWLSQMEAESDAKVMQDIADAITFPDTFSGDALDFPTSATRGATISWSTSNGNVVKSDGTVIRPNVGQGNQTVTITATITLNGQTTTASWDMLVPQRSTFNRIAEYDFENDLTDSLGKFTAGQATGDRIWNVGGGAVSYAAGHDGQAVNLDGTAGVRLPDGLISNYEYSVSFWINPTAITGFTTGFFGAINEFGTAPDIFADNWISMLPQGWDGNTMFWSHRILDGTEAWFDGLTGQLIAQGQWTHVGFSVKRGLVKVFINGQELFSSGNLTDFFSNYVGHFALGVNYWDLPFNGMIDQLKIYDAALEADEMKALDIDNTPSDQLLQIAVDLLDLGDLSAVKEDIHLPRTGPFAAAIDWVSSDPAISVQSDTGIVTRPDKNSPAADVTLTATITLDGQSMMKQFPATVSNLAPPDPIAVYSFEDNLDDSTGNFASGTATGNLITAAGGTIAFDDNGAVGKALTLNGSTGVFLDNDLVTDATYSISLWLKPSSFAPYTTALFGGPNCVGPGNCNSWISVVPGGTNDFDDTFLWSGTAWYDARTNTRIPANQWSQFVAVDDGGNISVYLNGVLKFSGANYPDVFSGVFNRGFWLGVNNWDPAFVGSVDEVKFYDEAMTADDVAQRYAEEAGP